MGLNAELLAEELAQLPAPPKEALGLVAAISREVDRLDAVAEEYLRFSRPPRASAARVDVAEVLGGLLDFLGPELSAAKVEVRRELAPGLPPVRADEGQLRAVFLNLVRNSREAMPGGGTVTAVARPEPAGGRAGDGPGGVEVRLSDTGGGIPAGDLTRIFEPFYSTKERGTGLGLAYVREVVVQHGGTIRCDSEVGRGTTFTIRLPGAAPDLGADAPRDVGGKAPGLGAVASQDAGG
ncbi:MAG: ATP-binding protein [Anaeromyxobacteraceae bacterium]